MKVILINRHIGDKIGGSEVQSDIIARGLQNRGHEVIYLAMNGGSNSDYSQFPYTIIRINPEEPGVFTRAFSDISPDIIYWRFNKNYLKRAVDASKSCKIPFAFAVSHINDLKKYAHKWSFSGYSPIVFLKTLLYTIKKMTHSRYNYAALKHIDGAIFQLSDQRKISPPVKNTVVIGNSAEDILGAFDWPRPYCLWVSNIKASKRPEDFIKLAESYKVRNPRIDFLMIGDIQEKSYEKKIDLAREISNFHYLGFKDNPTINSALKGAICLISTGLPEGYPNIMIQAWLQGCPTLALEYDPNGFISEMGLGLVSGNHQSLVDDLESLVNNPDQRALIGLRAKKFAKEHCSPSLMVNDVESFLKRVVTESG